MEGETGGEETSVRTSSPQKREKSKRETSRASGRSSTVTPCPKLQEDEPTYCCKQLSSKQNSHHLDQVN